MHWASAMIAPVVDASHVQRYDQRAPRYTSYPTALELDRGVSDAHRMAAAQQSRSRATPLSVYAHIPFCRQACAYCGCARTISRDEDKGGAYLARLLRELSMQADLYGHGRVVEQFHLGGGTPTFLNDARLEALVHETARLFSLSSEDTAERSIEIDPRTVDKARVTALAAMGFNRMSLGVQDFDTSVQETIRRIQSVQMVADVVDAARAAGVRSIGFDLIYGLPEQTEWSFDKTLDEVVRLRPDRISVFGYAHLPSRFPMQRSFDPATLPTPPLRVSLLSRSIDRLHAAGYVYIGMDHFALPGDDLALAQANGTLHRNFQGYSTHAGVDLVGLGATAIGRVGRVYVQNQRLLHDYMAAIDRGELAYERGMELDDDDVLRADVIQALTCYGRIDVKKIEAEHHIDFWTYFLDTLAPLARMSADGLVQVEPNEVTLTPSGRVLVRAVCVLFDRYRREENRHSAVV